MSICCCFVINFRPGRVDSSQVPYYEDQSFTVPSSLILIPDLPKFSLANGEGRSGEKDLSRGRVHIPDLLSLCSRTVPLNHLKSTLVSPLHRLILRLEGDSILFFHSSSSLAHIFATVIQPTRSSATRPQHRSHGTVAPQAMKSLLVKDRRGGVSKRSRCKLPSLFEGAAGRLGRPLRSMCYCLVQNFNAWTVGAPRTNAK